MAKWIVVMRQATQAWAIVADLKSPQDMSLVYRVAPVIVECHIGSRVRILYSDLQREPVTAFTWDGFCFNNRETAEATLAVMVLAGVV